jgi:hypothetical protein
MINEDLANYPPQQNYEEIKRDCVFIGSVIKNLYDEKRICIKDTFDSKRYRVSFSNLNLYGITKEIAPEHKKLSVEIKKQKSFDLIGYNLLLNEYNLNCNDCFFNLKPPIYPVDSQYINTYIDNFSYDQFICFNHEVAKFQAFTNCNLFFIINP